MLLRTPLANRSADGPLVANVGWLELGRLALLDQASLGRRVNETLQRVLAEQPEGSRIELEIRGWSAFGFSGAEWVAGRIQSAWEAGSIIDPDTGRPVQPWPEYPHQVAWGDRQSDTLTLRSVKAALPIFVWWILAGALAVVGIIALWEFLTRADWTAQRADLASASANDTVQVGKDILGGLARNWRWIVLGIGALAVAPFVLSQVGELQAAKRRLRQ